MDMGQLTNGYEATYHWILGHLTLDMRQLTTVYGATYHWILGHLPMNIALRHPKEKVSGPTHNYG